MYVINKSKLKCPECGAPTRPSVSMSGAPSNFYMSCTKCNTFIDTYIPLPHQYYAHKDPARYIGEAGGYGTGKTLFDVKDIQKHIYITPKGRTLMGAPTIPQLKSTLKKDFEEDFPVELVQKVSKVDSLFTTINNHEVLYRSFDDPHKLRSLNLSRFVILEASGAKYSVFTQLQNRLRNIAATKIDTDEDNNPIYKDGKPVFKADWRKGTIETNPDPGWVKSEFLETAGTVYLYGSQLEDEQYQYHDTNSQISMHVVPTNANFMLPEGYIEEQTAGKPSWWINRYFGGSFLYAEGLVYPSFARCIVDGFDIPRGWKRLIAMDYGINDNTHFVFIAIDNTRHIAYVYDELIISDSNVTRISDEYKKRLRALPQGALLQTPVMDQRSMSKRQSFDVSKTLGDLFLDEGILFDPAQMNVDARVLRTNTLLELGQLKIFRNCSGLIREGLAYKFPEKDLDKPNANTDKPMDKFNHGINALEFAVMQLPHNLENLNYMVYNVDGKRISGLTGIHHGVEKQFDPFSGGDKNGSSIYDDDYMFDFSLYDD